MLGVLLCFLYPADVTTTKMLTEEERTLALARLQQGQVDGSSSDRDENMSFREVGKIICHPQILVGIAIFICSAYSRFELPSKALTHSPSQTTSPFRDSTPSSLLSSGSTTPESRSFVFSYSRFLRTCASIRPSHSRTKLIFASHPASLVSGLCCALTLRCERASMLCLPCWVA